jgi:hypothetical protein
MVDQVRFADQTGLNGVIWETNQPWMGETLNTIMNDYEFASRFPRLSVRAVVLPWDMMAAAWVEVTIALLALLGAALGAGAIWFTSISYRKQATLLRTAALIEPRIAAYSLMVKECRAYADESSPPNPVDVPFAERQQLAARMQAWYYEHGGWLMDGNTFNSYLAARTTLLDKDARADPVFKALSMLRTDMKIELGVREPSEREAPLARSEERGY